MRFRLALALSMSVLLIGIVSWNRFMTTEKVVPSIVAVEHVPKPTDNYKEVLSNFTEPKINNATSSDKALTSTDLISRQLIMDYVSLASNGSAGVATIDALAEQYAASIPTLNNAPKIGYLDIKSVTNTRANFENYSEGLAKIYTEHSKEINRASGNVVGITSITGGYYSFVEDMGKIYLNIAQELKKLAAPTAITTMHLQLINNLLSSAAAMESMQSMESDPMTAIAGLTVMNENLEKESVILAAIDKILKVNGI